MTVKSCDYELLWGSLFFVRTSKILMSLNVISLSFSAQNVLTVLTFYKTFCSVDVKNYSER